MHLSLTFSLPLSQTHQQLSRHISSFLRALSLPHFKNTSTTLSLSHTNLFVLLSPLSSLSLFLSALKLSAFLFLSVFIRMTPSVPIKFLPRLSSAYKLTLTTKSVLVLSHSLARALSLTLSLFLSHTHVDKCTSPTLVQNLTPLHTITHAHRHNNFCNFLSNQHITY